MTSQADDDPGVWVVHATLAESAPTPEGGGREGFGRDVDEARAHAGWGSVPNADVERYADVNVQDRPGSEDQMSARVVEAVTRWHIDNDDEIPRAVIEQLQSLIDGRLYASAIAYFFDMVWDRGFEDGVA